MTMLMTMLHEWSQRCILLPLSYKRFVLHTFQMQYNSFYFNCSNFECFHANLTLDSLAPLINHSLNLGSACQTSLKRHFPIVTISIKTYLKAREQHVTRLTTLR
jgi:hypothetical protein